jgi:AcrR family transcriptional regulator
MLLDRIMTEVAMNGLADRSLRDIAEAVGSSHRMLHYHFGSRAGLVTALVEATESAQRDLLIEITPEVSDPAELVMALWHRVSSPELRPFVRLFFECVAVTGGEGLTDPWVDVATKVARAIGMVPDEDELRLGVAVTRGLLIDVLAGDDATAATRSIERFVEMWNLGAN